MEVATQRTRGLVGATMVGVGAIVGGGILALSGVAFATTGPAAIVAFALNGLIALITAKSFADLAVRFPESGGTYTYAKKVLSIEVAFGVGWVVWFASIVAGVLYALGFAAFAAEGLISAQGLLGLDLRWLDARGAQIALSIAAVGFYTFGLVSRAGGGGDAATVGKVVVFAVVVLGGIWAFLRSDPAASLGHLVPFLPAGPLGLVQAMGYTFIALQGFDLIAAVGGEVKRPERNLPRAMYLSLAIALAIYLPLLFLIATVGVPAGLDVGAVAEANPEGLVAEAAGEFLGPAGYWLIIGAGLLSMLSALQANLLGASRVAFTMARDRTLPRALGRMRVGRGTPAVAALATAGMVALVVLAMADVSAAGAASSLIFLVSFATVHWASILARRRSGDRSVPALPLLGMLLCLGLALFQGFLVPSAGSVVAVWLLLGTGLYFALLAPGARLADVSAEARDPELARLRGRSPLVLVPVANPASAASLVDVATTLRTPGAGRILMLSVIRREPGAPAPDQEALLDAQRILGASVLGGFERDFVAESLFTVSDDTWGEIERVAVLHQCSTVLVGLPKLTAPGVEEHLETLISGLDADVVVVRAPAGWRLRQARRVLVPIGGQRDHSLLRTRLLARLTASADRELTFLRIVGSRTSAESRRRIERSLRVLARDEVMGACAIEVEESDDAAGVILRRSREVDLVILGAKRRVSRRALGQLPLRVARDSEVPLIVVSHRSGARATALPFGLFGGGGFEPETPAVD